jgi:beta-lactamase class A
MPVTPSVRLFAATLILLGLLGALLGLQPLEDGERVVSPPSQAVARSPTPAAPKQHGSQRPQTVPADVAVENARRYARARPGIVSFAVVNTRGRLRGELAHRRHSSASVVKSLLLAAELRRLERNEVALDATTQSLLRAMIVYSDNDAADAIYGRVGDPGLIDVARSSGMERFTVAGHWGNAQITAGDMARMFSDLESVYAGPQQEFALGLLGSIVPEQRWGIPAAAPQRWAVRFKGGWVTTDHGQITHQAAELRDSDRLLSMAILTDEQPSMAVGTETVRGVADRLLEPPDRSKRASSSRPGQPAARRGS